MISSDPKQDFSVSCMQFDALTKLPNRAFLVNTIQSSIAFSEELEGLISLFLIHFDALDRFNDVFGIDVDERIMLALSENIQEIIGADALLARVGNYQLAIVQDNLQTPQCAERLAKQLQHLFSEPLSIDANLFYITASIGISLYPLDAPDAYTLLKTAENTMQRVKKEGKNLYAFTRSFSNALYEEQVRLMQDLPAAIENGELYFAYQCQYSNAQGRCIGAEMLARWNHPVYGNVPPAHFIPLAEQSGMIGPLTIKALIDASQMFKKLEAAGRSDISLSINISPVFLMTRDFIDTVRFMVESYELGGRRLNFEITEELLLHYPEQLFETFEILRGMNIGIEIDDFGTGYTSLKYLTDMPVDRLKIDRSFVRKIDSDRKRRALFRAIVEMAEALEIGVMAEGVETAGENDVIRAFESLSVQGHFIGRPMVASRFLEQIGV